MQPKPVSSIITPVESDNKYKVVLHDITIDIEESSKIGIVGKNGCGKSTLLKIIHEYGNWLHVCLQLVNLHQDPHRPKM